MGHVTTLSLADWLNFSVASFEAEKMFIGLGPGLNTLWLLKANLGRILGLLQLVGLG